MKTLRFILLSCALITCALLAGCSKSEDNKPPTGVSGVTPDGQMEMHFRWIAGKQYSMRMDLSSTSETDLPGQKSPMKQLTRMTQDYTISVVKELPDGGKELELEFQGLTMESKAGDRVMMNFDSTQDPSGDGRNPVAPLLRKMIGGRLKYVTDADGKVDKIEGVSELAARISQGSPPQIQAAFSSMYSEGYFKQLCDVARMAPGRGVKPGDTWRMNVQEEMGSLGTMTMNIKLKFEDWDQHGTRKCARIASTGDITSKPSETPGGPASAMTIEIEKGKVSGTGWFDPELGMVVDTVADQDMTMKITTQGKTFPTRTNQKVNVKLLDVADVAK